MTKYFGVVEGFYRKPYTVTERLELFRFMKTCGLNTYVYGPKADSYHRKKWKKAYPSSKYRIFMKLSQVSKENNISFNYALSPVPKPDAKTIIDKFDAILQIGIKHFSLFFDDIDVPLTEATARSQTDAANQVFDFLSKQVKNPILFFCPTQYRGFKLTPYIKTIAAYLNTKIEIFWTGKKVVAPRITKKDIQRISEIIKRAPLIWDNIFANDYLPGIIWRYPYRYREPSIVPIIRGVLINPMNQFQQSKILIKTAAEFFAKPKTYVPRKAWQMAKISTIKRKN